MIYFIQSPDKSIKIGFTNKDPNARLKSLQTGSHYKLILLGVIPGNRNLEIKLHNRFKNSHIRGEWYKSSDRLIKFINKNALPYIKVNYKSNNDDLELCLGKAIRTLRIQKMMYRETLCILAGVSMNALRHLETGKGANVKTLVHVARALGKQDWIKGLAPIISINPLHMVRGKARQRVTRKTK